jgi:hypothetical protein
VSDDEWPPIYEIGTRVEVDISTFDLQKTMRGTILLVDCDPEDPLYFVQLDFASQRSIKGEVSWQKSKTLNKNSGTNESLFKRWIVWDCVRPLGVLEVLAENV